MNTTTAQPQENQLLVVVFGIVSALLVAGVLTNTTLRFGVSDRVAFFAFVVIGMAICGVGKLGQGAIYGWANPLHLIGYVLGAIGLVLAVLVWFNIAIPYIATERSALLALAGLMLLKVGVAQLYRK